MVKCNGGRLLRNLSMTPWQLRRAFAPSLLDAIRAEIAASERLHGGQLRFAVEGALPMAALLRGQSPRERALEVFSLLRVWDTEHNNGVLIYLLLAERDVEIVADRGIDGRVTAREWQDICHQMEVAFHAGRYETGALEGVRALTRLLVLHFPTGAAGGTQLPDSPVLL